MSTRKKARQPFHRKPEVSCGDKSVRTDMFVIFYVDAIEPVPELQINWFAVVVVLVVIITILLVIIVVLVFLVFRKNLPNGCR